MHFVVDFAAFSNRSARLAGSCVFLPTNLDGGERLEGHLKGEPRSLELLLSTEAAILVCMDLIDKEHLLRKLVVVIKWSIMKHSLVLKIDY